MCVKVIASQRWDIFWDTGYNIRKGKCSPIQKTSVEADYCHYVQSECRSDVSPITVDRLPVFSARYRVLPLWFGHVWTKCIVLKQLKHHTQPTFAFSAVFQCPGSVSSLGFLPFLVLKQYHWEEAARTLHGPDQPTLSKHWRKLKALTLTTGLALSFFHPSQDSLWKGHCCPPMLVPLPPCIQENINYINMS